MIYKLGFRLFLIAIIVFAVTQIISLSAEIEVPSSSLFVNGTQDVFQNVTNIENAVNSSSISTKPIIKNIDREQKFDNGLKIKLLD